MKKVVLLTGVIAAGMGMVPAAANAAAPAAPEVAGVNAQASNEDIARGILSTYGIDPTKSVGTNYEAFMAAVAVQFPNVDWSVEANQEARTALMNTLLLSTDVYNYVEFEYDYVANGNTSTVSGLLRTAWNSDKEEYWTSVYANFQAAEAALEAINDANAPEEGPAGDDSVFNTVEGALAQVEADLERYQGYNELLKENGKYLDEDDAALAQALINLALLGDEQNQQNPTSGLVQMKQHIDEGLPYSPSVASKFKASYEANVTGPWETLKPILDQLVAKAALHDFVDQMTETYDEYKAKLDGYKAAQPNVTEDDALVTEVENALDDLSAIKDLFANEIVTDLTRGEGMYNDAKAELEQDWTALLAKLDELNAAAAAAQEEALGEAPAVALGGAVLNAAVEDAYAAAQQALGIAMREGTSANDNKKIMALIDAYKAALAEATASSDLYNKINPAVSEDYHLLDEVEKAYDATKRGIAEELDAEYGDVKAHYTEVLGALKNEVEKLYNDEDGLTEEEYDALKELADQYEAELKGIKDRIAELEAANEANYETAKADLDMLKQDLQDMLDGDVDHPETECPSTTAQNYVKDALAAAQDAIAEAEAVVEGLYEEGYLCTEGEFLDANAQRNLQAALNAVDGARDVFNTYVAEVRYAEANDAAYEELTAAIEEASQAWTQAYNALEAVELPKGTGHDECYEELKEDAVANMFSVYKHYVEGAQTWAADAYDREALIDIAEHETVGEKPEIEEFLAGMTDQVLAQAKNVLEDEIARLQANDAAYEEFFGAASDFFQKVFTPTLNIVENYEIPYEGHDECYEALQEAATEQLEGIYEACNSLVQLAEYYWHHDEANAEIDGREDGETQHSMVAHLDELLRLLNEVLTKEVSDVYNEFKDATDALEANDAAYYEFMNQVVGETGLEVQWTQVYNATVKNEDNEALYNADGEGRVELYEAIKDYYTEALKAVTDEIQALAEAATEAWHSGEAPEAEHNFLAEEENLYGQLEAIQIELTGVLNEYNSEMEEWAEYLENERIYRYEYQDGIDRLHAEMERNQAALAEVAETAEYKGFPYPGAEGILEAYKALGLVGACVETDKVATDQLFKEDSQNFTGEWTPDTEFAYTTHCTHSEGGWAAEFAKHMEEISSIVGPVVGDLELFKANVDVYEELAAAVEAVQQQYTQVGNVTVNNDDYEDDPFVEAVVAEYAATLNGIYGGVEEVQNWLEESFQNRTLVDEEEDVYAALENVQIALTAYLRTFAEAIDNAHVISNGKTIYSDQEYFTVGFFKTANDGEVEQAEEMFNTVEVLNEQNIWLRDVTFGEEDEFGYAAYVNTLVNGTKANELAFEFYNSPRSLAKQTFAAGPATIEFEAGSIKVDGFTTRHDVTMELTVVAPEVEETEAEVAGAGRMLVLHVNNPIDLTYTINSLVATTNTGAEIAFADAKYNENARQIEFELPEGTTSVEIPAGFFTFRTGENTIARSAALSVAVAAPTSIDSLIAMGANAQIFDLEGRQVKAEALVKGQVYVVNGSKTIVK